MAYLNQNPALQAIFDKIYKRLLKLENAKRFTAPNVTLNPSAPVKGDIWLNTTDNKMRYLDATGTVVDFGSGGGGGGGGTKVTFTSVTLGTQAGGSSTYFEYALGTVAQRGLVTSFTVTPSVLGVYYDLEVRSAASGEGQEFLAATGISNAYSITSPWYYEATTGDSMYIRIKNTGTVSATFVLTFMRIERWA